jgi:capsular exopolysaccharide synthesis family protein
MGSTKIVYQVVDDLQLWVAYILKNGLVSKDLYKRTPVKFQFIKETGVIGPKGYLIPVVIKNRTSFVYTDEYGVDKTAKYGEPIKSTFGTWKFDATPNLSSYIDSTMQITVNDRDLVADLYKKNITVELQDKDAPFVNLSMNDNVPDRGKDVLNDILAVYLQHALESKNKLSQSTLKFIDYRLDSLKSQLTAVERQIEEYKGSHHITWSVDTEAVSYQNIRLDNVKQMNAVDIQLGILATLEKYSNSVQNTNKLPVSSTALGDASLSTMYDKLTDMEVSRGQLLVSVPETSPLVKNLGAQIEVLKTQFRDKISTLKAALLAQKHQLELVNTGVQSFLTTVPTMDRELNGLKRVQQSKDLIYKFLLEKREQVGLRYASTASDSEIVDDAHASKIKWPIPLVVYALGILLGCGAAAGLLFLREAMNDLVLDRRQIEEETGLTIIGELGYQKSTEQIVVSEGRSKFAIGEQFRVLRTNLYHLHGNSQGGRVTLFTSSVSGEGKSFVSTNLAVTLAYASRKTIILEMDLRKPKVSVNFGLSPESTGISNFLSEQEKNVNKLIQPSGIPGLDVLSCGSILPNPSELLEKDKLDELINTLKEHYDEIIIDSPPIHLVTDALVIARVADASLYVVRQGYTHKHELEFIAEINESQRFPKFSIVFNGIKGGSGSSSGYGYGYGYGYNYSSYNSSYNSYAGKEQHSFGNRLRSFLKRF